MPLRSFAKQDKSGTRFSITNLLGSSDILDLQIGENTFHLTQYYSNFTTITEYVNDIVNTLRTMYPSYTITVNNNEITIMPGILGGTGNATLNGSISYLRIENGNPYRYGFNGQEQDNQIQGDGNTYTAEFWEYDPRLGKRWNVDPMTASKPWMSPYHAFSDNPILNIDPNGAFDGDYYDENGIWLGNDKIDDGKVYHVDGASKFSINDFQEGGKYFNNHEGFNKDNGEGYSINQWSYSINDAKFAEFLPTLLDIEGGFVNNKNDRGGATNKGITLNAFKKYSKSLLGVDGNLENLKRLTTDQAAAIYEVGYWNPSRATNISDKQLSYLYFDTYVNGGASNVLRATLFNYSIISSHQINSLNTLLKTQNAEEIYNNFRGERNCYYLWIIRNNPSQAIFQNEWFNRVNSFQYESK